MSPSRSSGRLAMLALALSGLSGHAADSGCDKSDVVCLGATGAQQYRAPDVGGGDLAAGSSGVIWLGDLGGDGVLHATVADAANHPIARPDQFVVGQTYVAAKNLNARDGTPRNDEIYFKGLSILGLVRIGRTVTLLEPPVAIKRPASTQIWGRVQVMP